MKRKVIIHKHLFKNAGTTFDWILKNNYGNAFCDHRDDIPMRDKGEKYLINFLEKNPEIKALSSHHIWFTFSPSKSIELIPVYFLRHPIERIRSVYMFERKQQSETSGAKMAKKTNFREYVEWRMRDNVSATIRNFQTRYFAGVKNVKHLKDHHLQNAIKELKRCPFVGIVEYYDESMLLFEQEFKKLGIGIDLTYEVQNVTQKNIKLGLNDRINSILEDLGDLSKVVLSKNNYDIHLYEKAIAKLKNINNA